jgi:hypothetical protein
LGIFAERQASGHHPTRVNSEIVADRRGNHPDRVMIGPGGGNIMHRPG